MTTAFFAPNPPAELAYEHRLAVIRLDVDLRIVVAAVAEAGTSARDVLPALRRSAIAAYRDALASAAGRPYDRAWRELGLAVAAFIERIPSDDLVHEAYRAARRLAALASENAG